MKNLVTIFGFVSFVFFGCGPSLEGEQKAWDNNLKTAKKLKSEYSAFSELIADRIEKAKETMDEAQGISDEEAKVQKMVEANNFLEKGAVGNLKDIKSLLGKVKDKRNKLKEADVKEAQMTDAEDSKKTARKAIEQAENLLTRKTSVSIAEAEEMINRAYNSLKRADDDIAHTLSVVNKKEQQTKEKEQAVKDSVKTEKEKEDKKIECPYCGSMVSAKKTKCPNCGATIK